jgi:hypothetical protein
MKQWPDELRTPTAGRLLAIFREVEGGEDPPAVRGLLCNAGILAESCYCKGERLFAGAEAVLDRFTCGEMEDLLTRLARGGRSVLPAGGQAGENPNFDPARFAELERGRA